MNHFCVCCVKNYSNYSNATAVNGNGEAGRGVAYGKRPTSGGVVSSQHNVTRTRNDNVVVSNQGSGRTYTGGRTAS